MNRTLLTVTAAYTTIVALLMAVGLAIYTVPSPADVRGAFGIQDAQNGDKNDDTDYHNRGEE